MVQRPGLRERNKQRTREEIARAAHELFVERGYDATTVPDIAQAAGVSTRTIFGHFPSKEDILFSDLAQLSDALAQSLAERAETTDALTTIRQFLLGALNAETSELDQQLHRCINLDPAMRRQFRARVAQLEAVIAPAIAKDLGTSQDDPGTQLVTASLTTAFNLLADRETCETERWTATEAAAQVDQVFTFLRGGLEALKKARDV